MTEKMQLDLPIDSRKMTANTWNVLLKYAVKRVLKLPNFQKLKYALDEIFTKLDENEYDNGKSFLADINRLKDNSDFPMSTSEAITDFRKNLKTHVKMIESCPECYLNEVNDVTKEWFKKTCSQPHLLVWVKIIGYPYWPAKSFYGGGDKISVRFFGDVQQAYVPAARCFLFSRQIPVQPQKLKNGKSNSIQRVLDNAMKDVNVYIRNITSKFGAFNYANFKTPLNIATYTKHVQDMIATNVSPKSTFGPSTKLRFVFSEGDGIVASVDHDIAQIIKYRLESCANMDSHEKKRKIILTEQEDSKLDMILRSSSDEASSSFFQQYKHEQCQLNGTSEYDNTEPNPSITSTFYSSSIINKTSEDRAVPKLPSCDVENKALFEKDQKCFVMNALKKQKRRHEEYRQLKNIFDEVLANKREEYEIAGKTIIQENEKKMWCIVCYKEGRLYCCLNTSYCDESCQVKHWKDHMKDCKRHTFD